MENSLQRADDCTERSGSCFQPLCNEAATGSDEGVARVCGKEERQAVPEESSHGLSQLSSHHKVFISLEDSFPQEQTDGAVQEFDSTEEQTVHM